MKIDALGNAAQTTSRAPADAEAVRVRERVAASREARAAAPKADFEALKASYDAAARQIEEFLRRSTRSLEFRIDSDTGTVVATIKDRETGEVVRQIPGEEMLRLARALQDDAAGALIDLTV